MVCRPLAISVAELLLIEHPVLAVILQLGKPAGCVAPIDTKGIDNRCDGLRAGDEFSGVGPATDMANKVEFFA